MTGSRTSATAPTVTPPARSGSRGKPPQCSGRTGAAACRSAASKTRSPPTSRSTGARWRPFLIGADGDQANTEHVQVRGFTVTNPKTRVGLKPTYTQGSGTGSTITDDAPIKLLNNGSTVRQRDILIENGTIVDPGFAVQIISYTGGAFQDGTIILRGISLTGTVSSGTNWLDQNTYPSHVDFRGITVPAGSTPASAPTAANS
jgi:hypothetical protein